MPKCYRNNNEYIEKATERKATYNKRKKGLTAKLDQITTLCGVEACAIINGPYKPGYEVWPNDHEVVRSLLIKFRSMSVMDRSKHMENKTMYLENRIKKLEDRIKKQMTLNRGLEMDNLMSDCLSGQVSVADDLDIPKKQAISSLADQNVMEIDERLQLMENQGASEEPETSWYPTDWFEDYNWNPIRGDGASSSKTT
ncbi:transcription factor, MADS-box [Artemisia annua]|uniref:Transcription factor, MADS-box n=1 Tax=Artemisia annua TaxID=35608 RepID=A0A2U1ND04_ARTAN|nr:transcription factor, MADS-box [Artemisia annua]